MKETAPEMREWGIDRLQAETVQLEFQAKRRFQYRRGGNCCKARGRGKVKPCQANEARFLRDPQDKNLGSFEVLRHPLGPPYALLGVSFKYVFLTQPPFWPERGCRSIDRQLAGRPWLADEQKNCH